MPLNIRYNTSASVPNIRYIHICTSCTIYCHAHSIYEQYLPNVQS